MATWEELGRGLDAQQALAARERGEREAATRSQQAHERQNMAEARRLVGQFLEAMRKAGNPGRSKQYSLLNKYGNEEFFRRWGWYGCDVQVYDVSRWTLQVLARSNDHSGVYVTESSEFCSDEGLAKLKLGLASILRDNNVPLPRD